jgi:UDP:flavonoid glycosyltransferase YjiC (YdhE family)
MRFAFASIGSLGDLHPMLAMAVAAKSRGHEVVVAAAPSYAANVARAGVEFHPLRPEIPEDAESLAYYFDLKRGPRRLLRDMIFADVAATHEDLCGATRGADLLVVGELLYTAPIAAADEGIPWLNVVLAPTSMLSATDPCVLAPAPWLHKFRHLGPWLHRLAYCFGRIEGRMWAGGYYRFRRSLGLPAGANPIFDAKHSPLGTLAMFPDFLAAPQPDWPEKTVQAGFPFYHQGGDVEVVRDFLKSGSPPVLFTLGSIVAHFEPFFYQAAAEASQILGRRAILLTGRNAAVPQNLPESVLAVNYAPLHSILPHACAVVHAGGIGTCAEALRAGLPSVVIPFSFDQPDNAARLRRLGVAEILPRSSITAQNLAAKLHRLLTTPSATSTASRLAARIDPQKALDKALDKMESLVGKA